MTRDLTDALDAKEPNTPMKEVSIEGTPVEVCIDGTWSVASQDVLDVKEPNTPMKEVSIEGTHVEVCIDKEGFQGCWFTATIVKVLEKNEILIQYKTRRTNDNKDFLKEVVDAKQIRVYPPNLVKAESFSVTQEIDVFYNGCWSEGVICNVLQRRWYKVYIKGANDELLFRKSYLRPCQNWIDGTQFIASQDALDAKEPNTPMQEVPIKGTPVEVCIDKEGLQRRWFPANIVRVLETNEILIGYKTIRTDDNKFLMEVVDAKQIRVYPPNLVMAESFSVTQEIDVFYNRCWCEGVIINVLHGRRYKVYIKGRNYELLFEHSDLRPRQDWIDGTRFIASQDALDAKEPNTPMKEVSIEGTPVEVRIDREGLGRCWFPANIVRVLETNEILIGYKTIRTDNSKFLMEVVDAKQIRVYPPNLVMAESFSVTQEIDVFNNGCWYEGVICDVPRRKRYKVYIQGTKYKLRSRHSDLRPRQDWIDGTRFIASQDALDAKEPNTPMKEVPIEETPVEVCIDGTWSVASQDALDAKEPNTPMKEDALDAKEPNTPMKEVPIEGTTVEVCIDGTWSVASQDQKLYGSVGIVLVLNGCILLGYDSRASIKDSLHSDTQIKMEQLTPTIAMTMSGSVYVAEQIWGHLKAEIKNNDNLTVSTLAERGKEFAAERGKEFADYIKDKTKAGCYIAGFEEQAPKVYAIKYNYKSKDKPEVSKKEIKQFAGMGSGKLIAMKAFLHEVDDYNGGIVALTEERAKELVAYSLLKSALLDRYTGGGLHVAHISSRKIEVQSETVVEAYHRFFKKFTAINKKAVFVIYKWKLIYEDNVLKHCQLVGKIGERGHPLTKLKDEYYIQRIVFKKEESVIVLLREAKKEDAEQIHQFTKCRELDYFDIQGTKGVQRVYVARISKEFLENLNTI